MAQNSAFSTVFLQQLDDLEREALQAGSSLTAICKHIGISRATPDRWRHEVPRTIEIMDQMQSYVADLKKGHQTVGA
jgi:transposase-like protein